MVKPMSQETKAQLDALRKDLFLLQEKHLDLLVSEDDPEIPPTRLEMAFCKFLWEIDEARRAGHLRKV